MSLPHTVSATVSRLQHETVTLTFADGQSLAWPRRLLHAEVVVGDTVHLAAFCREDMAEEREQLARAVLNDMLRPGPESV